MATNDDPIHTGRLGRHDQLLNRGPLGVKDDPLFSRGPTGINIGSEAFSPEYTYRNPKKSGIIINNSPQSFWIKVLDTLADAKACSPYLAELLEKLENSPVKISIKPVTSDPSTRHRDGSRTRSHTKPLDGKGRRGARNSPTSSEIYIYTKRITKNHRSYKSGTFVHELVHAYDLATGNYHSDHEIREKRAIFFQNIWRKAHSKSLRSNYHQRFDTTEYQDAEDSGVIDKFIKYYYSHNDIPFQVISTCRD